jgi:protein disulfide-isomerase A1
LGVALQLDEAAPILGSLKVPILIAKVNADKFTRLARKYEIEYVFVAFYLNHVDVNHTSSICLKQC